MDPINTENNNDDDWNGNDNVSNKFSTYEQECIDYIESTTPANIIINETDDECDDDTDDEERLNYERKLWNYFQSSAMAIAQLYSRDNLSTAHNVWSTFQQASTSVTCLYKESSDFHRKHYDRYRQIGYHKRTKEILNWIKKKKNLIRREDLLAFLGGHGNGGAYHHHSYHNHHHHHTVHRSNRSGTRTSNHSLRSSNLNNNNNSLMNRLDLASKLTLSSNNNESDNDSIINNNNVEPNLETFKEALHMRNSTVSSTMTNQTAQKRNNHHEDLHEFVDQQFHRHNESRKRTSSMDICMVDSSANGVVNKRTKFY
ncbi:uncharacterized protein LOC113790704 [Dermatophagoides pteronyssinus]|uniref:uncharacterized protein LOC113790704 n=1 Tax=Dermatophagoides pteronyssinus TaxID=6956 RepID=UPI003F66525F